jgi:penicillin-binding protein 1C
VDPAELARLREQNVQHGALVVLHNPTGEILAFHGSSDFASPNGGQINGALAPRSAGSTLKPFTYLLAFQN